MKAVRCIIILAALTLFNYILFAKARAALPDTAQINLSAGVSREEYFSLKKRFGLTDTALAQSGGLVKTNAGKSLPVRLVFTESGFARLTGLNARMANGAFFPTDCDNLAVIGEDLASELFMSNNVIGADLEIDNARYTICGVYKNGDTFAGVLSGENTKAVYLPLASDKGAGARVNGIFANPESAQTAQDRLSALSAENIPVAGVRDYSETLSLLRQNVKLQQFFILIGMAVCFCVSASRKSARLIEQARETHKSREEYTVTPTVIKAKAKEILFCAALLSVSVILAKTACFTPYLPQSILTPAGRIDIIHIFRLYINKTREINSAGDFWARYGLRAMLWSCAMCAGSLAAALKSVAYILRGNICKITPSPSLRA